MKRLFSIDHVLIGAFAFLGALTMAVIELSPARADTAVAVVFSPWTQNADAVLRVARAGGLLVRTGHYPFIVVVRPGSPDFASMVRRAGALFVLDASAVRGCFSGMPS